MSTTHSYIGTEQYVLEIETTRALSDAAGSKPGTGAIGRSGVEGGA